MPAGRPPIHTDPIAVQKLVDKYFKKFEVEDGEKAKKAPNLFGLCLALSIGYDAFYDYEDGKNGEELSGTFENARLRLLEYAGEHAYTMPAGSVFNHVNLSRRYANPFKNAMHQEIAGDKANPLAITITNSQADIV